MILPMTRKVDSRSVLSDTEELHRALPRTMSALLIEIRLRDSALAEKIEPTLIEIARRDTEVFGPTAEAL
jgi:hypothetical protein